MASVHFNLPRSLVSLNALRENFAFAAEGQSSDFVDAMMMATYDAAIKIIRQGTKTFGGDDSPMYVMIEMTKKRFEVQLLYRGEVFSTPQIADTGVNQTADDGAVPCIIEQSVDKVIYDAARPGLARIWLQMDLPS